MKNTNSKAFKWFCPNCGALVVGCMNSNGEIRVKCRRCNLEMVRKEKGRRHDVINMYSLVGSDMY